MSEERRHKVERLETDKDIVEALAAGEPRCVVGLNRAGDVQLELPVGCNCIVLSPEQADGLAAVLEKWAAASREDRRA